MNSKVTKLSVIAPLVMALAGCDNPRVEARAYQTVEDCVKGGVYTEQFCSGSYAKAVEAHEAAAPTYADKKDCEVEFGEGKCSTKRDSDSGSDVFVPLMSGFMLGNVLGQSAAHMSSMSSMTSPLYRHQSGEYSMPSGKSMSGEIFKNAANGNRLSASDMMRPQTAVRVPAGGNIQTARQTGGGAISTPGRITNTPTIRTSPMTSTFRSMPSFRGR